MMKLVQISVHFEYSEHVERLLDRHDVKHYNRLSMVEGKDREGRHMGTQVYPGNVTVLQAQVPESSLDALMKALVTFRRAKEAHRHLEALVLPIERRLDDEEEAQNDA